MRGARAAGCNCAEKTAEELTTFRYLRTSSLNMVEYKCRTKKKDYRGRRDSDRHKRLSPRPPTRRGILAWHPEKLSTSAPRRHARIIHERTTAGVQLSAGTRTQSRSLFRVFPFLVLLLFFLPLFNEQFIEYVLFVPSVCKQARVWSA